MLLRITHTADHGEVEAMRLEGWLNEQTAANLRAAYEEGLDRGRTLLLDVAGVRFIDPAGAEALRDLARRGCVLVGCSSFLSEMLRGDRPREAGPPPGEISEAAGEAQLLAELRAGSEAAFERLVRRQSGFLLAVARRMLANEEDARDAVQEAFVSAFKGIGGFGGGAKLSTWLHRIVVNAALMKLRSRRRRPEEPIEDFLPCFDENGEWASETSGFGVQTETLLASRQTRALVRRCIERLPETYRTVLLLRDIEELDTEEAARALGITANAVKIRLHRARQALRTLLERERVEGRLDAADAARGRVPVPAA